MRRILPLVGLLLLGCPFSPEASAGPETLTPVADSFTQVEEPNENNGTITFLRAGLGHGDERRSFLKFDVPDGTVESAALRIHVERGNGQTSTVHTVSDDSWTELGITWNNQPALGSEVGTFPTDPGWHTVDVTDVLDPGELNSFAITKEGEVSKMTSREGGNLPELVVEIDTAPPPPTASCRGAEATIQGTEDDDVLSGTAGRDVIAGLGGDDVVTGGDGSDVICGGDGRDVLRGNGGNDVLVGQLGDDRLGGGPGDDVVKGGGGDDVLRGRGGNDLLAGGQGRDTGRGGRGSDRCRTEVRRGCP